MKLYLISQKENQGYDTYNAAVVCAPNKTIARRISPNDGNLLITGQWPGYWAGSAEEVYVKYLGRAKLGAKQGLVLSSFNAG